MGFVPPPLYTGDPRTDWPRLRAWRDQQRRTRRIGLVVVVIAIAVVVVLFVTDFLLDGIRAVL
jgi:hypothetical protein